MYRTLLSLTLFTLLLLGTSPAVGQTTHTVSSGGSIQAAIDGASNGDTIEVEAGTYEESLTISKELTIQAVAGVNTEDITVGGVADACRDINITSNNVTLNGISVVGDSGASCDAGETVISVAGVENVTISNVTVTGPGASEKTGINLFDSDNITVENVTVTQAGKNGINVRSRNVTLKNITAPSNAVNRTGFGAIGVYANDSSGATPEASVTFDGDINLSDNPNGLIFVATNDEITAFSSATFVLDDITLWPLADFGSQQTVTVDGNDLDAFAALLNLDVKSTFPPSTLALYKEFVDDAIELVAASPNPESALLTQLSTGEYFVGQNSPTASMSIQTALDDALVDAVVNVKPGEYVEALTILTDGLTLQSTDGADVTTISADGAVNAVEIGEHEYLGDHPEDVTVQGFHVVDWNERGISQRNGPGPVFIRDNIVVNGNSGSRNGINISGGVGSEVTGNKVETTSFDQDDWSGTGILAIGANDASISDNEVDGADLGVVIAGYPDWESIDPNWVEADGNTVSNNTIVSSSSGVALAGGATNTTISSNTIKDNNRGVNEYPQLGGVPSGNAVQTNTIEDNTWGIRVSTGLAGNTAYNPITISDNAFAFTGGTSGRFYVVDGSLEVDISSVLSDNTYSPRGNIVLGVGGGAFNVIQPATEALVRAENGEKPANGEKLFVATGTSQQGNFKSYIDDASGLRVEGEKLTTPWWLDTDRSWQVDWDAAAQEITLTLFSDDAWQDEADQITNNTELTAAWTFDGLSIGARTTNEVDKVTYSAVQFDDGDGFKAVPEANASYTGDQFAHNFFAFAEGFDAKETDFSLRGQMLIEGGLTSSDNLRFDIKAVQVPPAVECPVPDFVENLFLDEGFLTITFTDANGIAEVNFVNASDEDALNNLEASPDNSGYESSDGIRFEFNDPNNAPTEVTFTLQAVIPEDHDGSETFTVSYFAQAVNGCGSIIDVDPIHTLSTEPAEALAFHGNYPNPFAGSTTIEFDLPEATDIRLEVFDLMGRTVATLVDGFMDAGSHQATWDGTSSTGQAAASGVYILRMTAGDQQLTQRITRLR